MSNEPETMLGVVLPEGDGPRNWPESTRTNAYEIAVDVLTVALDTVRERLTHLREHRIETNDEIRNLVAHEKRLSRMVRISQEPSHVDEAGDE